MTKKTGVNKARQVDSCRTIKVYPVESDRVFSNPLKGMRPYLWSDTSEAQNPKPGPDGHEYGALRRHYIPWNEIENSASDGIDAISDYCDIKWTGVEKSNIKVIPRVYLQWSGERQIHWPTDLSGPDWSSPRFKTRLDRMIRKLGRAWDTDPRVAYVEMGLYGKWGEHHSPDIPPDIMGIMGEAFSESFRNKLVMQRQPWDFPDRQFGIYWDSFAHADQDDHMEGIMKLGNRWKHAAIGGECAYDWGNWRIQPGLDAAHSLKDPVHRDYIYCMIKKLHANHLGWIDQYDRSDPEARDGAAIIQRALGYRFVLESVEYPSAIRMGEPLSVLLTVKNVGSSPFYYDWPVEISLLDPDSRRPVWKKTFENIDIRKWYPGDDWCDNELKYKKEAVSYSISGTFSIPERIEHGCYILALAVLDPAGNLPSLRFAINNYFNGGRHPIGKIWAGTEAGDPPICSFDDPEKDFSLQYKT